jgi:hypothetical protein
VSIIHKRVVVFSNHFFHRGHRRFFRVDPVKRRGGRSWRAVPRRTYGRPLFTAEARRGARSILQRSHDRMASQRRLMQGNVAILKSRSGPKGLTRAETARQIRAFNDLSRLRAKTFPRQEVQRARQDPAGFFRAPGISEGRSSSLPSVNERGFSSGLPKGSTGFPKKVSRKIPGGSALKGALKLPF